MLQLGQCQRGRVPRSEDGVVGMFGSHIRSRLSSKIIQLDSSNPLPSMVCMDTRAYVIHARDDFLGDGHRVNMVGIKSITKSADACRDLIAHQ
jgi:hypothetical protein